MLLVLFLNVLSMFYSSVIDVGVVIGVALDHLDTLAIVHGVLRVVLGVSFFREDDFVLFLGTHGFDECKGGL